MPVKQKREASRKARGIMRIASNIYGISLQETDGQKKKKTKKKVEKKKMMMKMASTTTTTATLEVVS